MPAHIALLRRLDTLVAGTDRFQAAGREIYLHCPGGYGQTKLSNDAFEKRLGVRATTRNWKTVGALRDLALDTRSR